MPELDRTPETAQRILDADPDPAVRVRLLRDVLRRRPGDPALETAAEALESSRWVARLAKSQQEDGSWGRFHTENTALAQDIPTTEYGVERAVALGLPRTHPILDRASLYIAGILEGSEEFPDPAETNDRWETGKRLFAASTLARIRPGDPALDEIWDTWHQIAQRTFASGDYSQWEESRAHYDLTGASVANTYLVLNSKYQLALLGARAQELDPELEERLVRWVWGWHEGVGYMDGRPAAPPVDETGGADRWLAIHELLAAFPTWRAIAGDTIEWLWRQRGDDGLWDLGERSSVSRVLPLSESWRRRDARRHDWSTRILVLMRAYYGES